MPQPLPILNTKPTVAVLGWHVPPEGGEKRSMSKRMSELSAGGLSLLQQVGAGGLIASIALAGLCAFLLLASGNEQQRRQAALADEARRTALAQAEQAALPEAMRYRGEAFEARKEAAALRAQKDEAEAEAERLAKVAASLTARLEAEAREAPGADASMPALPRSLTTTEALAALAPERARKLAKAQAEALTADLEPHAGDFSIEVTSAPDEEARLYAAQLAAALRQAGITTQGPYGVLTTIEGDGVFVSTTGPGGDEPGATVLSALQNASLPARPAPSDPDAATFLLPEGTDVRVYVGGVPRA